MNKMSLTVACVGLATAGVAAELQPPPPAKALVETNVVMTTRSLVIAERGAAPAYAVVIAAKASPAVRYAAAEFTRTIARQTGVALPVLDDAATLPAKAVLIGSTRHDALLSANSAMRGLREHLTAQGSANGPSARWHVLRRLATSTLWRSPVAIRPLSRRGAKSWRTRTM